MFKKMSLFILSVILLGTSFSTLQAGDFNTCTLDNITSSQEQTMDKIYTIFNNYQDLIEIKYPGTNFLVQTYLENLNNILTCESPIIEYAEFEYDTIMLLKSITSYDINVANLGIDYNDSLVAVQIDALAAYAEYDDLIMATDLGEDFGPAEEKRIRTIEIIEQLKSEMLTIGSYNDDPYLLNAFIENINVLTNSLENEEKRLIELYVGRSLLDGDLPENEVNKKQELLDSISQKDEQAYINIISDQEFFAQNHGFKLESE